jgi:hypothetical protein
MKIDRLLEPIIRARLFLQKAIVVMGPRQCGKTTLIKSITSTLDKSILWLNGDEADVQSMLSNTTSTALRSMVGRHDVVVIDEAQRIENIGVTIKLLVDQIPQVQVIASGSSSFELSNRINEPLTGRKYEFFLYPFSFEELSTHFGNLDEKRLLERRLIFGSYPDVVINSGNGEELLRSLSDSYLYKDILSFEQLRKPALLTKLLQALALQVASEVSYNELGQLIGADNQTIERYIDLLEKAYIVFRLPSLSRNLRNEIKKSRKIYFYDNGIRNAIIRNFQPINLRTDKEQLWENYLISERVKYNQFHLLYPNTYFWRTQQQQQEIDYIEDIGGQLHAFEIKWKATGKNKPSFTFRKSYPESTFQTLDIGNYHEWLNNS